ncbi:MAG: hypothetical protein R3Y45_06610 [Bacillota bacterium]
MENKQELSNVSSIFGIKRMIFMLENMPDTYKKLRKLGKLNLYIKNFERRATSMYNELIYNGKITLDDTSFGTLPYAETMTEIRYYAMQDVTCDLIESYDIEETDLGYDIEEELM